MLVTIRRGIKFAFKDFGRNIELAIATIVVISLALLSFNSLGAIKFFSQAAYKVLEDKIDVSVYFKPAVNENQVAELKVTLEGMNVVKSVQYINPSEALELFKEKHGDDTDILKSLEQLKNNPLGGTLVIKAKDPTDFPKILDVVNRPRYENIIQDKNFEEHKGLIQKIQVFYERLTWVGFVITVGFTLFAILMVINTVRENIHGRRDEIRIMKLVGATDWFIRLPYIIQSIFLSLIALLFVASLCYFMIRISEPYVVKAIGLSDLSLMRYFTENFVKIFGMQFVAVLLLNVISSWLAVNRYLKV